MIKNLVFNVNTSNLFRYYSTKSSGTKCYELRTYLVKPEKYGEFIGLCKEHMHMRVKHSPLLGYWASELGDGLNQVVHLWEYESLDERANIRETLAKDKDWNEKFMNKMRPLLVKQENMVLREFPWAPFKKISQEQMDSNKVWELRMYQTKPGQVNNWAAEFQKGYPERKKFSEPVGVFYSEFGALNTVVHLWPYKSFEDRFRIRGEALGSQVWVNTVNETMKLIDTMKNQTMLPVNLNLNK
ncbi:hypothetical protein DLAC_07399 [Tieghemostelium lacteum]|uniref:NIPSNAP domain-containing protein n=1 Tax=Tieghemostelium lacteum TaxID=361077 RepID=A0A151ZCF3_TIELA|nr:hypothetical protein DLAC_07399 [Tieghemostelium lacteum]|eukprot:KYQ91627.1 hypothetical protein DLAC_07399 [Tieghemostelium lacteum]